MPGAHTGEPGWLGEGTDKGEGWDGGTRREDRGLQDGRKIGSGAMEPQGRDLFSTRTVNFSASRRFFLFYFVLPR